MAWFHDGLDGDADKFSFDGITILTGPARCGKTTIISNAYKQLKYKTKSVYWDYFVGQRIVELRSFFDYVLVYNKDLSANTPCYILKDIEERIGGRFTFKRAYDYMSDEDHLVDEFVSLNQEVKKRPGYKCSVSEVSFGSLQLLVVAAAFHQRYPIEYVFIDLPETGLSPEEVVEYARFIVLINKKYGIRFGIATNHPDFVSAIRYVSEYEGTLDKTRFYYAEKTDGGFAWKEAKEDGDDPKSIAPIFEIFIKGIEKIAEYSNDKK